MNTPDIHRSVDSTKFAGLGQRYFHYWGDDELHLGHDEHRDIRIALCRVLKQTPTDGVIAFCGTGPRIALNRDLDSTLVGGHLTDHSELIFSDFSQDMLVRSGRTVEDISSTVASRSHLVIRDFSRRNFSARFDALVGERIRNIRPVHDMDAFIAYIRNEIGVQEISRQQLPEDHGRIDPRLVAKPDTQQGLHFDKILHEQRPLRLIVANLLISGMFAVTEMDFRRKLDRLRKQFPRQMTEEKFIDCLTAWHELILVLNEKVGKEFIDDALHANEEIDGSTPDIFLSADDTVTYTGLEAFDRVRMKRLKSGLPEGVSMREIDRAHWDHSHEEIPHKHTISVALVSGREE